jgi:BirA family biotin operon repressor/biotin-[acetyl-CoA-carboxylase] ligase
MVAEQLEHDLLRPEDIRLMLHEQGLSELDLIYKEETGSTNIDVIEHFQNSGRLSIAVSETQTSGRGRRGRQWLSPYARNIYCTIGLKLMVKADRLGLVSIACGVALCRAMESCGFKNVQIKWPNDLVYDDGSKKYKLGGILIESRPVGDGYFVAVGFGLNVHMRQPELDEITQPATSLGLISNTDVQRQPVLMAAIISIVDQFRFFGNSDIEALFQEFSRYDAYRNQQVVVLNGDDSLSGLCLGIDSTGQLLVMVDDKVQAFSAAEISLRAD